jgi:hypothetical protein
MTYCTQYALYTVLISIMQHIQWKLKVKVKICIEKRCILALIRLLFYFHSPVGTIFLLGYLEYLGPQSHYRPHTGENEYFKL